MHQQSGGRRVRRGVGVRNRRRQQPARVLVELELCAVNTTTRTPGGRPAEPPPAGRRSHRHGEAAQQRGGNVVGVALHLGGERQHLHRRAPRRPARPAVGPPAPGPAAGRPRPGRARDEPRPPPCAMVLRQRRCRPGHPACRPRRMPGDRPDHQVLVVNGTSPAPTRQPRPAGRIVVTPALTSSYREASPKLSKPGPRFADVAHYRGPVIDGALESPRSTQFSVHFSIHFSPSAVATASAATGSTVGRRHPASSRCPGPSGRFR